MKKIILVLSANPLGTDRLRLDKEVREIEAGLKGAKLREHFDIRSRWAVRFNDLRQALLDHEPHIVHFCGHSNENGLLVESDQGIAEPVSLQTLSGLFELCASHVRCVVLNACYSAPLAEAIARHIHYVIGMRKEVWDKTAVQFAVGIYDALGAGKSVQDAFKFGINAIQHMSPDLQEHLIPVLKIGPPQQNQGGESDRDSQLDPEGKPPIKKTSGPGRWKKRIAMISIVLLCLAAVLYFSLLNERTTPVDNISGGVSLTKEKEQADHVLSEADANIRLIGKSIADSLEKEARKFNASSWEKLNIPGKKLSLLFLYNKGPDYHLESLNQPLYRHIYKLLLEEVSQALENKPVLRKHIEILSADLRKCSELKEKTWLKRNQRSLIGLEKQENAVYEILLSIDTVGRKIHLGGKLILWGGEGATPEEKAFLPQCELPAQRLIEEKYNLPDERFSRIRSLINATKQTNPEQTFTAMASPQKNAHGEGNFKERTDGDIAYKGYPLFFKFKPSKGCRYVILLVKNGSGYIENLIPGTSNAVINGDYLLSSQPGTYYTNVLRDLVSIDKGNGVIRAGSFLPQREGEHTFYFFFSPRRLPELEELARLAESPGGRDVEITDSRGSIMETQRMPQAGNLDGVYYRTFTLEVVEPQNQPIGN